MSFGKARNPPSVSHNIQKLNRDITQLYGLIRARNGPVVISPPIITGTVTNSSTTNYLPISGGSMSGPLAYGPYVKQISRDGSNRGHLDVSKSTGAYSTNVLPGWNSATVPTNSLSYIDGAAFDGQSLYLLVPTSLVATISANGNIWPIGAASLSVTGPAKLAFVFDSTVVPPDGSSSGSWIMFGGANPSIAGFANTTLSNLGSTNINASLVPNADNSLNLGSISKRWSTTWSTIFQESPSRVLDFSQSTANGVWLKMENGSNFSLLLGVQGIDTPIISANKTFFDLIVDNLVLNAQTPGNTFDIAIDTLHGTRFGTSQFAKLAFFGAPPVVQQNDNITTGIAGATYTANERNMLNIIYATLENYGLLRLGP